MNPFFSQKINRILIGLIFLGILVLGGAGYVVYKYRFTMRSLSATSAHLSLQLAETKDEYARRVGSLEEAVTELAHKNGVLFETLATEREKANSVAERLGQYSSTVDTLEKLSKTDSELLKKYSKVYFLNEHYVPLSLSVIDMKYSNIANKKYEIHSNVSQYLSNLLRSAETAGLSLQIDSAFRSFGTQAVLKESYRVVYGAGTANQFSAEQGYSEHQLGTTVDFTSAKIGGGLAGFDKTPEYAWLLENAHKYGFTLSYPQGNTSYQYEPWHWRFVGVKLATTLHQQGMYFYDMDQREIDKYLVNIFD